MSKKCRCGGSLVRSSGTSADPVESLFLSMRRVLRHAGSLLKSGHPVKSLEWPTRVRKLSLRKAKSKMSVFFSFFRLVMLRFWRRGGSFAVAVTSANPQPAQSRRRRRGRLLRRRGCCDNDDDEEKEENCASSSAADCASFSVPWIPLFQPILKTTMV